MTHLLFEPLSLISNRWLSWVVVSVVEATVLLLIVSLVWLCIRRRALPQMGYILFLLVPLKLLVPLHVTVPARFMAWGRPTIANESIDSPLTLERSSATADSSSIQPTISQAIVTSTGIEVASVKATASVEPSTSANHSHEAVMIGPVQAQPSTSSNLPPLAVGLMAIWLFCVAGMFARFVWTQVRFWRLVNSLPNAEESLLTQLVLELSERIGVRRPVRIVISDQIAIPAVCGLFRPTLLLPRDLDVLLSTEQLQWVLLHELAHIRRRDLLIVVLQRCVAMLYCFNPAVWIANRIIHALREYACDDLAMSLADGTAIDSGEALLRVLRQVNTGSRSLSGALGVFGLDARASCTQRLKRLLDADRTIRVRLSPLSICGLILLAVLVLPRLHAADEPTASSKQSPSNPSQAKLAKDMGQFELKVVGPEGKPVPHAAIEIRTTPGVAAEDVVKGKFERKAPYGNIFTADADGYLTIKVPADPKRWDFSIKTAGFGPYWAEWTSENDSQQIPALFTAELEAAWTAGGIVVDSDGKPIEGVSVKPSFNYKKRPGDTTQLGFGAARKTDKNGLWRFDHVPVSNTTLFLEINHPQFMPLRQSLARDGLELLPDQQPTRQIVLERGLSVRGVVTDDSGLPIEGALVRTKFLNDIRETKTDKDGNYVLAGCEERLARIVVSAKGKAVEMQEVRINTDVEPVNFELKPGGKVRIRVVDDQDRPVPKARIFFQHWRGNRFEYFEFDHVKQDCNNEGVWEWNEAPLDGFQADICPPDGMVLSRQTVLPRDEEYVFKPPQPLVITGRVVDAVTKQPVKNFDVVPGIRHNHDNGRTQWLHKHRFTASNGQFQRQETGGYNAYLVRIEALGYRAVASREIKFTEGKVQLNVELMKGHDVEVNVVAPDGSPADNATIAMAIPGTQINVDNGHINDQSSYCQIVTTTADGRIRFPQQDHPYQMVIVHPAGCAHVKATTDETRFKVELQAWSRIEGTFRLGAKPQADAPLSVDNVGPHGSEPGGANIYTTYRTASGTDGKYAFNRVWPGRGWVGREIVMMVNEGALELTSSSKLPMTLEPGQTAHADFGGIGRPIVGKLQTPDGAAKIDWKQQLVQVEPRRAVLPALEPIPVPANIDKDVKRRADWIRDWQQTEPGKAWLALQAAHKAQEQARLTSPFYRATVTDKGEFRIENVPEGDYTLSVMFRRSTHDFSVPASDGDQTDQEQDLGILILK